MFHDCVSCQLARSASWEDFEQKIRDEYAGFRKAGGKAFIGFWIPHVSSDQEGHLSVHCPGSYSLILGFEDGLSSLSCYDEEGEIETITVPWQEIDPSRLTSDKQKFTEQPWLDAKEANSVIISARKAVDMLRNLNEHPINAWFCEADWVMEYD